MAASRSTTTDAVGAGWPGAPSVRSELRWDRAAAALDGRDLERLARRAPPPSAAACRAASSVPRGGIGPGSTSIRIVSRVVGRARPRRDRAVATSAGSRPAPSTPGTTLERAVDELDASARWAGCGRRPPARRPWSRPASSLTWSSSGASRSDDERRTTHAKGRGSTRHVASPTSSAAAAVRLLVDHEADLAGGGRVGGVARTAARPGCRRSRSASVADAAGELGLGQAADRRPRPARTLRGTPAGAACRPPTR